MTDVNIDVKATFFAGIKMYYDNVMRLSKLTYSTLKCHDSYNKMT